ncbi:hypothetical protein B0O80DRAFT_502054 [Mortierella sp. GBAus27b]|nr:hypothetical protein BGX31_007542 [Mortierella sp. GBA43]KAI8348371.1 hypothetical protein B0O80DRAFT_502054 [Mortierella sp. GBAus27b]
MPMRSFVRRSSKRAAVAIGLVVGAAYMMEAFKIKKKEERFSDIIENESKLWQGA